MRCVIRVKGHVDPFWQTWLEHLAISHERDCTTLLSGSLKDQAALYGVLIRLRDLGLTLVALDADAADAGSRGPIEPTKGQPER